MAHGLLEAQRMGPIPTPKIPDPNTQNPNVIPYSDQLKAIAGPVDPLTGPSSPNDISGLVQAQTEILAVFKKLLIATRANHPSTIIAVKGARNLIPANDGETYSFYLDNKPVQALALQIQNTSGTPITVLFDKGASPVGIQIPTGAGAGGSLFLTGVAISKLGIWVTAQTQINGLDGMGQVAGNDVFITAWSNPEYSNIWGQA